METRGVFGLLKPDVDVHTMGLCTIANLLRDCGYTVHIAAEDVNSALEDIRKVNNWSFVKKWLTDNGITRVGYSYRLDPKEGCDYFMAFYSHLKEDRMFVEDGGNIEDISFAGLPPTPESVPTSCFRKPIIKKATKSCIRPAPSTITHTTLRLWTAQ